MRTLTGLIILMTIITFGQAAKYIIVTVGAGASFFSPNLIYAQKDDQVQFDFYNVRHIRCVPLQILEIIPLSPNQIRFYNAPN